jgi:hypothetical protein
VARLPIPRPARGTRDYERLADLAREISANGKSELDPAYAELNAITARLYSLSFDDYQHIVNSFPLLPQALRTHCLSTFGPRSHGGAEP